MFHYITKHDQVLLDDDVWQVLGAIQEMANTGQYQAAGENVWDAWERLALKIGVEEELAGLGRAVMREFYQHDWSDDCADEVSAKAAPDMLALALHDPPYADARWRYLLNTDDEWRKRLGKMPTAIRKEKYE